MKSHKRKANYGISQETFDLILARQENRCAICKRIFDTTAHRLKPNVDHDHKTREVRALLCGYCNSALGELQDDPQIVLRAYEYLKLHKGEKWDRLMIRDTLPSISIKMAS